jgi:hypothetical protein
VRTGIVLATVLQRLHAAQFKLEPMEKLLLHPAALASIRKGRSPEQTADLWTGELEAVRKRRASALIYP